MSIKCISEVWDYSNQKGNALLLMLALADYANDEFESYPSKKTLARKIRANEQTVDDLIKKLIQEGELIRVIGAGVKTTTGATNRYRIVINKEGGVKSTPVEGVKSTPLDGKKGGVKSTPKPSVKDYPLVEPAIKNSSTQEPQKPTTSDDFIALRNALEGAFAMVFNASVVSLMKDDLKEIGLACLLKAVDVAKANAKGRVTYNYVSTIARTMMLEEKKKAETAQAEQQKRAVQEQKTRAKITTMYDVNIEDLGD